VRISQRFTNLTDSPFDLELTVALKNATASAQKSASNGMDTLKLLEAIQCSEPVSGFTHEFYRYPARFSPTFVREAIRLFSDHGDLVFDPFMGGGTTIVESRALGRPAIGTDVSSLAVFIAEAKSSTLGEEDFRLIQAWARSIRHKLNAHGEVHRDLEWLQYQRNISSRTTWPIRKLLEQALSTIWNLPSPTQRRFARCVLLRTGQWALDCRSKVPSASQFRNQLRLFLDEMLAAARHYTAVVRATERLAGSPVHVKCLHRSAVGIELDESLGDFRRPPRLVLTSPPYPGVHVLYHRWQIRGRRESPAPFWIANSLDGNGASFYTFGARESLDNYFSQAAAAFRSVALVSDASTMVVQMIAFAEPKSQLPRYLEVLESAGLSEIKLRPFANSADGRAWRSVPNRKWYARQKEQSGSSNEVVLFHRKK
jgi:hypothetical protein